MPSAGRNISIPTKLLATGVACALAIVVCGTAATVVVASNVKNMLGNPARALVLTPGYRANSAPERSFEDAGATARTLDSLIAPLGAVHPVPAPTLASPASLRTDPSKRTGGASRSYANLSVAVPEVIKLLVEHESDAGSRAAEEFAANRDIHPSLRVKSLSTIALGGCRNLPELVFGFSAKRRDAMARAVANIQDIDRGAELGARQQQFLEYAMKLHEAPPRASPKSIPGRSALLSAFSWIVPPGVQARAALCLEQGL
ncbi:MAG: hypothetical protein ABI120_09660 [Gemmatimonadaceae bacterium]